MRATRRIAGCREALANFRAQRDTHLRFVRFVRFVFAAGASVPINIVARIVFSTRLDYGAAVLLAHGVGALTAYTLTRLFVFERSGRRIHGEFARFAAVNVVSATITWAVSVGLVDVLFPAVGFRFQNELVAHITGLGCSAFFSFIAHSRFTFGKAR
jgi:putative flippase GtrA